MTFLAQRPQRIAASALIINGLTHLPNVRTPTGNQYWMGRFIKRLDHEGV